MGAPGPAAPCRGVPRPGRTILGGGASDTGLGSEPRPASRSLGHPVQLHGAAGCSLTAAAPVTRPRARADLPCALREAVGRGGEGAVLGGPGPCPPRGPPPRGVMGCALLQEDGKRVPPPQPLCAPHSTCNSVLDVCACVHDAVLQVRRPRPRAGSPQPGQPRRAPVPSPPGFPVHQREGPVAAALRPKAAGVKVGETHTFPSA